MSVSTVVAAAASSSSKDDTEMCDHSSPVQVAIHEGAPKKTPKKGKQNEVTVELDPNYPNQRFHLNELIYASYGSQWFRAKVLAIIKKEDEVIVYYLHYLGWSEKFDDWRPYQKDEELMKCDEEGTKIFEEFKQKLKDEKAKQKVATTLKKNVNRKRKQIKEPGSSELDADQDEEMKEDALKERAEGEEDQSRKRVKQPPVKLDTCSVCLNEFAASNDQLRLLPCLHTLCRTCGIELINRNSQKNTLTCPECQQSHIFDHPNIEKDAAILIDRCPTYHQAWNRNEHLRPTEQQPPAAAASSSSSTSTAAAAAASTPPLSAAVVVSKVFYCTVDGCTKLATHMCLGCGYQCAEHERTMHLDRPDHIRVSLEEQKKKQLEEERRLQLRRQEMASMVHQIESTQVVLNKIESAYYQQKNEIDRAEQIYRVGLDDESKLLDALTYLTYTFKRDLQSRRSLSAAASTFINQNSNFVYHAVKTKKSDLDRLIKLTPDQRKVSQDYLQKLIDLSPIQKKSDEVAQWWTTAKLIPIAPHPLTRFIRELMADTLLPTLEPALRRALQGMLTQSGKSLDNAQFLYRANRDGWTKDAFINCCLGKSHTLILVKVEGNGFILGAYIAPPWSNRDGIVSDPSGQSFLFSLRNRHGCSCPLRWVLGRPTASAVTILVNSILFGHLERTANGDVIRPFNFGLFLNGRPGNDSLGNATNPQNNASYVYQLDEESKKTLPNGFQFNGTTFSGQPHFGASEIEVYQL